MARDPDMERLETLLPPSLYERAKALADKQKTTISALVRKLLEQACRRGKV